MSTRIRRETSVFGTGRPRLAWDPLGGVRWRLAVLSERPFRMLWTARTLSAGADAALPAAVAFAVVHTRGSIAEVGLVVGAFTFSRLILTLVSGVWADRLPRRLVVLGSHVLQTAAMAAVVGLLLTNSVRPWELILAASVYGVGSAFVLPAVTGLVAETVSAPRLQQANALIGISLNVGYTAGPAVGGLLAAAAGPAGAFALEALACAMAVVCMARLHLPPLPRRETGTFLRDMADGWRELLVRPWYLLNICAHGLWNFGTAAFWVLGPLVATSHLGGPAAWSAIATGGAVGAFAGGLIALRWAPQRPLVTANLALALSALELLALVGPSPLPVVVIAALVGAAGLTFLNVAWDTTMQQIIPEQALSRVSSCDWLISTVPVPVAYALIGPLSLALGVGPVLIGGALAAAGPCALVVLLPGIRGVRRLPDGRIVAGRRRAGRVKTGGEVRQLAFETGD